MGFTHEHRGMLGARRRIRRRVAGFGACCAIVTLLPSSASAATRIHVDTDTWPTLGVSVVVPRESASPPRLFENGRRVSIRYANSAGRATTIALAVDHSQSMHGQALRDAVAVARRLLADRRRGDRVALIAIGSKAVQLTGFSRSSSAADKALNRLAVDRHYGTALYDGVVLAARALRHRSGNKALILVTDGQETTSQADIGEAASAAANARAPVYPVAIVDAAYRPETLNTVARATRGAFIDEATGSPHANYRAIPDDIGRISRMEYTTAAQPGDAITLRIAQPGSPPQITRVVIGDASSKNSSSFLTVALSVLGALAAVVFLFVLLGRRRRS